MWVQLSPVGVAMALPSLLTEPFPVFDLKSLFRAIPPLCSAFMTQLRLQRDEHRTKIRPPFKRRCQAQSYANPRCQFILMVTWFMWHHQKRGSRRLIVIFLMAAILLLPHTQRRKLEKCLTATFLC